VTKRGQIESVYEQAREGGKPTCNKMGYGAAPGWGSPAAHCGRRKEETKTRIDRTHKTPVEVYQLRVGPLEERPGETTPFLSEPRNESVLLVVVIAFVFRFQGESTFGLKEKSDRVARHPPLWPFEGQYVVDLLGEYLHGTRF